MSATTPARTRENALATFRHAGPLLVLLFLVTVVGFWKTWLGILNALPEHFTWTLHVHGVLMLGWLVALTLQAWLVRWRRLDLHRLVGRSSYVYVPVMILSGVVTMLSALRRGPDGVTFELARDAIFQHAMLASLALTWGLAIAYRKRPALHIRFMISTVFAVGTAIFFRVFFFWVPGFSSYEAGVHGNFAVMGVLLAALIANDWRVGVRRSPFWVITALLGAQYAGYAFVAPTNAWIAYCRWLDGLFA